MLNFLKKKQFASTYPVSFIIASPRSGTTWLSKSLNTHPKIFVTENRFFGNYADFIRDQDAKQPRLRVTLDKYVSSALLHHNVNNLSKTIVEHQLTKKLIDSIVDFYINNITKPIIIDKITPYVGTADIVINQINKYFPESKIIYLVRDGRDVVTSGVFHWFNKEKIETIQPTERRKRNNIVLGLQEAPLHRFFLDNELEEWTKTWSEVNTTISTAQSKHKVLVIHYEDMLDNQAEVLSQICSFLKVNYNEEIGKKAVNNTTFKQMSRGRIQGQSKATSHIRKGIKGDWKNYFTKKDGLLFQALSGKALVDLGYESNNAWLDRLPDTINLHKIKSDIFQK